MERRVSEPSMQHLHRYATAFDNFSFRRLNDLSFDSFMMFWFSVCYLSRVSFHSNPTK